MHHSDAEAGGDPPFLKKTIPLRPLLKELVPALQGHEHLDILATTGEGRLE